MINDFYLLSDNQGLKICLVVSTIFVIKKKIKNSKILVFEGQW